MSHMCPAENNNPEPDLLDLSFDEKRSKRNEHSAQMDDGSKIEGRRLGSSNATTLWNSGPLSSMLV